MIERVIAAAYKVKPEFESNSKTMSYQVGTTIPDDIYRCRIARHHAEIIHLFGKEIDRHTDGFYTSFGRWVDRKDAAQIALSSGQIKKLHYWRDKLDSSDLFDINE